MSDIELKPCPRCHSDYVSVECSLGIDGDGLNRYFYYGFCGFCHMAGPDVNNEEGEGIAEEQAAAAWNHLPRHLCWTTKTPTEPGWYWYRLNEKDNISMTYVDVYGTVITYYPNLCPDGWSQQNLKNIHGQWAGPIPEPQEPK